MLANYLGIPKGVGEHGQADALTSLLACIKQGHGGSKKGKFNVKLTGLDAAFDLKEQDNGLGVCFQLYGKKETFVGGELTMDISERQPRWFHFGKEFPIQVKHLCQSCRPT